MVVLEASDTFEIKGRGTVHAVQPPKGWNPYEAMDQGEEVMIDGKLFVIRGVEYYTITESAIQRQVEAGTMGPVGLLVKESSRSQTG